MIDPNREVGLCAGCTHAQVVTSSKGSVFYLCGLWTTGRYAKYPLLPVLRCDGFMRREMVDLTGIEPVTS